MVVERVDLIKQIYHGPSLITFGRSSLSRQVSRGSTDTGCLSSLLTFYAQAHFRMEGQ